MATTTYIDTETVVLNHVLKHIDVNFSFQFYETQLRVEIDEEKLLNELSKISDEYEKYHKSYTGIDLRSQDVDKIIVKIGDYTFSGSKQYEVVANKVLTGIKKDTP